MGQRYAGRIWSVLETVRDYPDDLDKMLKGSDHKFWLETVEPVRLKLEAEKALRQDAAS